QLSLRRASPLSSVGGSDAAWGHPDSYSVAPVGRDHLDAVFLSERVRVVGLVSDEPPCGCAPDRPLTVQLLQLQTVTAGLQTNPHRRSKPGVKLPYRFRTEGMAQTLLPLTARLQVQQCSCFESR
ncbi:MAG: hypothetical protein JWP98_232, partial [Edaphobacter sp.]|nr:hypothetical protein [Edaphobacter sp.]